MRSKPFGPQRSIVAYFEFHRKMSGSSLTSYNSELVKALEDLREQREEMNRGILRDEEEKARIQKVCCFSGLVTDYLTHCSDTSSCARQKPGYGCQSVICGQAVLA